MFGIGMPEMIMILAIALVVIGPKKLPELAKSLGRALGELKKATRDFKESMEFDEDFKEIKDVKKTFDEMNKDIRDAGNTTEAPSGEKSDTPPSPEAPPDPPEEDPNTETEEVPKDGPGAQ
jgi:Tat protein translocase TatB subunit